MRRNTKKNLIKTIKCDSLNSIDCKSIVDVLWNFDKDSVMFVKKLAELFNLYIVISSTWKYNYSLDELKCLFKIHNLWKYIKDVTPNLETKEQEIEAYIEQHKVKNYIIFDDFELQFSRPDIADKFIKIQNKLTYKNYKDAFLRIRRALKNKE